MTLSALSAKTHSIQLLLSLYMLLIGVLSDLAYGYSISDACKNVNPVHLDADFGIITSSDRYPLPENSSGCRMWYIQGNPNETITLSFDDYDLPTSDVSECTGGQIIIGPDPNRTICGSLPYRNVTERAYISHRNHVWIKYIHYANQLGRGFKLTYIRGPVRTDPCPSPYYRCGTGICILTRWLCNGADECSDGSDEANCTSNDIILPSTMAPFDCGNGFFRCPDTTHNEIRCFPNSYLCDGKSDCTDGKDEENCGCEFYLGETSGFITSPNFPNGYNPNMDCQWIVHVKPDSQVQLRFVNFTLDLSGGDYLEIRDHSFGGPVLAWLDYTSSPPKLIESYTNIAALIFHTDAAGMAMGFNVTYQQKGVCLPGQTECLFGENDCFDKATEMCNGVWNCPLHGGDERGCDDCNPDIFSCGQGTQCYREEDRCNGIVHCSNKADESNCSERICGPHNGTFLCHNQMCIYESWHCDGANDCGDNSDEINCTVSRKVVTAAVIGSLICALLLTVALGCTCQLHALRQREQHNRQRYRSPLTRIQDEIFAQRLAPPNYNEAMVTSRPFEEVRREFLEQMQAAMAANGEVDLQSLINRVMSSPADRSHGDGCNAATSVDRSSQLTQTERRYSISSNISDDMMTNLCAGLANHIAELSETSNVLVNVSAEEGISAQWRRSQPKVTNGNVGENKSQSSSGSEASSSSVDSHTDTDIELLNIAACDTDDSILNSEISEQLAGKGKDVTIAMEQINNTSPNHTEHRNDVDDEAATLTFSLPAEQSTTAGGHTSQETALSDEPHSEQATSFGIGDDISEDQYCSDTEPLIT